MNYYTPLPDCLTIKESPVHGLGLFATEDIPADTELGITHYEFTGGLIRTPLGGFYNHSNEPNCHKIERGHASTDHIEYSMKTSREIKAGEEILLTYTWYTPGE